jgi:uncharacterized protein (DUF4415 family)
MAFMSKRRLTKAIITSDGRVMAEQPTSVFAEAEDKTGWKQLAAIPDEKIDYDDIPEIDEEVLEKAVQHWPPTKKQWTIRVGADVLAWLKGQGKRYQTRINHMLRVAMEHQRSRHRRAPYVSIVELILPGGNIIKQYDADLPLRGGSRLWNDHLKGAP